MRWRSLVPLAVVLVLVTGGCSRLSFIKQDAQRRGMDQVAPDYNFRETESSKRRAQARRHVAAADRHMRAGEVEDAKSAARAALKADRELPDAHTLGIETI